MTLNMTRARERLASGDLRSLFIEELGWDRYTATLKVTVDGLPLSLDALAQKRGMVAYHCPAPAGQPVPDYGHRRKIENQVAKSAHEHLIVFTDSTSRTQIWQWLKREPGKPVACREHAFHPSQPGDALLQKLGAIAFTLDEEERLTLSDVTRRARAGFDVDRVTRQFYDRFQKEHATFLKFIVGISESADREWYASVMLNRLMFVYFIQRKGFLDGDRDYLRNRLAQIKSSPEKGKFHSFYRYFLLRLFHEGLGGAVRSHELEALVGRVPYLNGGLFDVHELEDRDRYGTAIQIPDEAFERIFDYFDQYQWHLDERPLRADNEINPDVLGYIFEKYINQKQMGAYYTKEDITEYISRSTVLPSIIGTARANCRVAFENAKDSTVWALLRADPDRYIFSTIRHGLEEEIPSEITSGLSTSELREVGSGSPVGSAELRPSWNQPAPATHALPAETWREVVARRERHAEIRAKLAGGEVRDTDDLITLNLDIRQFTQDAIENCEGPDLLRAFWHAIQKVTILDPTCGSGAFLFAALNILEPLYEACLERMSAFVEDAAISGERHRLERFGDFRKVLGTVDAHPNRRYFIFKSIILNNLFGVDIMEEAVEICKLRLFLKLAAQVEPDASRKNLGVEPLPDIDFNIRAGNTLVGYATLGEVKQALARKIDFFNAAEKIELKAAELQQAFDAFRARQIEGDGSIPTDHKQDLLRRLKGLEDELNVHLAYEYGVDLSKKGDLNRWKKSHEPFHWFVEFYGIMTDGGFDVILGNPPYVQRSKIRDYVIRGYKTDDCPDIYAPCVERSLSLLSSGGRFGMILPISAQFSDDFKALRSVCQDALSCVWASAYSRNPAALFSAGLGVRSSIVIAHAGNVESTQVLSSRLNRWIEEGRPNLFEGLAYYNLSPELLRFGWPRVDSPGLAAMLSELVARGWKLAETGRRGTAEMRFKTTALYYVSAFVDDPPSYDAHGRSIAQTEVGTLRFANAHDRDAALTIALGKIGLAWWAATGDDFHITAKGLSSTPVDSKSLPSEVQDALVGIWREIERRLRGNVIYTRYAGKMMGNYDVKYVRDLTDRADVLILESLGLRAYWDDIELAYARFMKATGERPGTVRRAMDKPVDGVTE